MIQVEINAPQREEHNDDGPIGAQQLKELAFLRFDDREYKEQRGSRLIDNQMNKLYGREQQARGSHIEECSATPNTQAQTVDTDTREHVYRTLPHRLQVLRKEHANDIWQQ